MPLPQIISRNNIQRTNKRATGLVLDVLQPTTWYTCPTGKMAIVKGTCVCGNTGAAASATLQFNGAIYATWKATGGSTLIQDLTNLDLNISIAWVANLAAGETIVTDQNTGTNAEFRLQFEVEEFLI